MDAAEKMVVGIFHFGNQVAGINAYKVYEVLYDKEEAKRIFLPGGHMQGSWKNLCMILFSLADCIGSWLIWS
jgi:hypothetical protein